MALTTDEQQAIALEILLNKPRRVHGQEADFFRRDLAVEVIEAEEDGRPIDLPFDVGDVERLGKIPTGYVSDEVGLGERKPKSKLEKSMNCGTGSGGFKPGNTCAGGGSKKTEAGGGGFTPAKTIKEAEQYAKDNFTSGWFRGVSYKGMDLDVANEINATYHGLYKKFPKAPKMRYISSDPNSKNADIVAAYVPFARTTLFNTKACGTQKQIKDRNKKLDGQRDEINQALAFARLNGSDTLEMDDMKTLRKMTESGFMSRSRSVKDIVTHEFGHHVDKHLMKKNQKALRDKVVKKRFGNAHKISAYAQQDEHEYIAEGFTAWANGDKLPDENMAALFEAIK